MIFGIPYIVWLGILGAIGLMLYIAPSGKKRRDEGKDEEIAAYEQFKKSLEVMTEMRWVNIIGAKPKQVTELLNKIEVSKITVMYQFFVREGKYDMFFRCRQSQQEELKKIILDLSNPMS